MGLRSLLFGIIAALTALTPAHAGPQDVEAIMAADKAFYAALSARDLKGMTAVWAAKPYTVNIGPRSKTMNIGAEAVAKYWEGAFTFFSELNVTKSNAHVQTDGSLAWVTGNETATLQPRNGGNPLKFETFVTHVFEKQGDRWLLVLHHAQMIPD
jgi:ketosteroid isomerase-like protein